MRNWSGIRYSTACHCESRHSTALRAMRIASIRNTWPAQFHLFHKRTPCSLAAHTALRVDLLIQSTHGSSGLRRGPAIRLSIAFQWFAKAASPFLSEATIRSTTMPFEKSLHRKIEASCQDYHFFPKKWPQRVKFTPCCRHAALEF